MALGNVQIYWLNKISLNVIITPLRFLGKRLVSFFLIEIYKTPMRNTASISRTETTLMVCLGHSVRPKSCVKLLMKAGIN